MLAVKLKEMNMNFFYILKVTEERSRIRTGSVFIGQEYASADPDPNKKCHGSPTLTVPVLYYIQYIARLPAWKRCRYPPH